MNSMLSQICKISCVVCFFCFLVGNACAQDEDATLRFLQKIGGGGSDYGVAVEVDINGNIYSTGAFSGTVDIDPGAGVVELTSAGGYDIFVLKQSNNGELIWVKRIGGAGTDQGIALTTDSTGNLLITGNFSGTVDFDPGLDVFNLESPSASAGDFIAKFSEVGNLIWARAIGRTSASELMGIDVDGDGNVYTGGAFHGIADFDPGPETFNLGITDQTNSYICKLDIDGEFIWAKALLGSTFTTDAYAHSLALNEASNVYVVGTFNNTVDFDPGPSTFELTSISGLSGFIVALAADGSFIWARALGGDSGAQLQGVAIDPSGNICTAGSFHGTIGFYPGPPSPQITSIGDENIVIGKLDSAGTPLWLKGSSGTTTTYSNSIAVDGASSIYTVGTFYGTTDFDPGPNQFSFTASETDLCLLKLNSVGDFIWAKRIAGSEFDSEGGVGLDVDSDNNVYALGFQALNSDLPDILLAKFTTAPMIESIARGSGNPTNDASVVFNIQLSQDVLGLDISDLVLFTSGLSGATVADVSGYGSSYSVSVSSGVGDGTLRLDLVDDDSITSVFNGMPLGTAGVDNGSYTGGESYTVDKSSPVVSITTDFGNGAGVNFTTSISSFTLQGTTSSDTVEVRVNGVPMQYVPGETTWLATIDLASADPTLNISIVTIDAAGNASIPVTISITYDPSNDADGDGLTDQEEAQLVGLIPSDPLDPTLPARDWYVSAASGTDNLNAVEGGGTQENPWRTIGKSMTELVVLSRENFPVRVLLDDTSNFTDDVGPIALHEESVSLIPFVSLLPKDGSSSAPIHIRPATTGNTPVILGADHSVLRSVVVRPALSPDQARALLQIVNVSMTVENVTFDGLLRQDSTGIDISGSGSSDSLIRHCNFINIATGVLSTNSGVAVSDNTFNNIAANGAASRAVAIGFTVLPGKEWGQVPELGSRERILETGFNRFRGLPAGAKAIEFVNVPTEITSALYNDWGVYTETEILQRISVPGKGAAGAVAVTPFIPEEKAVIPGSIVGVILSSTQSLPIAVVANPTAVVSTLSASAAADTSGIFRFDALPSGVHLLSASATGYIVANSSVDVASGRITIAPRFLLEPIGSEPVTGDVNGDSVVDAIDVQLTINSALGITIGSGFSADIDGDGDVDAVDVQLVINAALGLKTTGG